MINNNNNKNICPKCSSEMILHPSSLSMPLTSQTQMSVNNTNIKKTNIEDQEASFTFRFNSCSKCGYTEFYLAEKGKRI
jgi:predicted nucleic-acid-binding Zn-ribbon protein